MQLQRKAFLIGGRYEEKLPGIAADMRAWREFADEGFEMHGA